MTAAGLRTGCIVGGVSLRRQIFQYEAVRHEKTDHQKPAVEIRRLGQILTGVFGVKNIPALTNDFNFVIDPFSETICIRVFK